MTTPALLTTLLPLLLASAAAASSSNAISLGLSQTEISPASCAGYHGSTASGHHLYTYSNDCDVAINEIDHLVPYSGASGPEEEEEVWLSFGHAELDEGVFGERMTESEWVEVVQTTTEMLVREAAGLGASASSPEQLAFGGGGMLPNLLFNANHSALLSLSPALVPYLMTILPPTIHLVSHSPKPLHSASNPNVPSSYSLSRLQNATKAIRFNPLIQTLISTFSPSAYHDTACIISGEDEPSDWISRHSFSEGIKRASKWAKKEMEQTGAECEYFEYTVGFAPAIVCKYAGLGKASDEGRVVLSAHFDSRGSFGEASAPGADDDGSGSAMLLTIARSIHQHNVSFHRDVYLVFFTGEEQGLWASRFLSQKWKKEDVDVVMMLHADMIAYRKPGEPMQMAVPNRMYTPEAADFVLNITQLYSPELSLGVTTACCSDQQSFFTAGYPAMWVFERHDAIADPAYHQSTDRCRREGYDPEQAIAISKSLFAAVLELAGFWV